MPYSGIKSYQETAGRPIQEFLLALRGIVRSSAANRSHLYLDTIEKGVLTDHDAEVLACASGASMRIYAVKSTYAISYPNLFLHRLLSDFYITNRLTLDELAALFQVLLLVIITGNLHLTVHGLLLRILPAPNDRS